MTVAGIALIAGGLAILVVFRRVLWGSGESRRGPATRANRRGAHLSGADTPRFGSIRRGGGAARADPEPDLDPDPWWDQEPALVGAGAEPSAAVDPWGPPSRAVRRRLRRAAAEHGRLASIGLADDEDAAFADAAFADAAFGDAAFADAAFADAAFGDAAFADAGEPPVDAPHGHALDDQHVADPAPDARDHYSADPVEHIPHDTGPDGAAAEEVDPPDAAEPGTGPQGRDHRAADDPGPAPRDADPHDADPHEPDPHGPGRHDPDPQAGSHGRGGHDVDPGLEDHHTPDRPVPAVAAPAAPASEPPPVTSLEPDLHRFAHLGSVRATPDDDHGPRHSGEPEGPRGHREPSYRYGDRVDGWVRPDDRRRTVEREPLPAGEYWLPVSDPYADSGYGDHGYGVAPREVAPYEPVPHDVVPHTMSSYEIAPAVEPMPSPPFDASGVLTGEPDRPGRDGRPRRSRHASPTDPPSPPFSLFGTPPPTAGLPPIVGLPHTAGTPEPGDPYLGSGRAGDGRAGDGRAGDERAGLRPSGDPWADHAGDLDGGSGDLPEDGDTGRGRQSSRRRRAGAGRRTRADGVPPAAEQPTRPRAGHPRSEGRRRHPADLPPVTGETTQKLPPMPVVEGQPRPESGRIDGGRLREPEPAGRPRPRPRPRPSGTAQVDDQRQANRSTVYVSRHAADPG